jgi:hypothetical protein
MTALTTSPTPVLSEEPQARRWNRDEYYRMGDIGLFQDQRTELIEGEVLVNGVERRWTRDEFHRMADIGLFHGQRAELIEGEIMVLSPQKAEHFTAIDQVAEILRNAFGSGYYIRMQGPLGFRAGARYSCRRWFA